jgi:hypothetical protein
MILNIENLVASFLLELSFMIETVDLVHAGETVKVPFHTLALKCNLFADDPALMSSPYSVRALPSVYDFRQFVLAIGGFQGSCGD